MEYWSDGVMIKMLRTADISNTPILQYSKREKGAPCGGSL
jgi:hypothetical protein